MAVLGIAAAMKRNRKQCINWCSAPSELKFDIICWESRRWCLQRDCISWCRSRFHAAASSSSPIAPPALKRQIQFHSSHSFTLLHNLDVSAFCADSKY